jgi:hypothetical protein
MHQRWSGCALRLAVGTALAVGSACSGEDSGPGGGVRNRPGVTPTPVGTAGGAAAAGSGGPAFNNPTQMTMAPVTPGSGLGPMNNLCEVVHLTAKPTTPDILIVLDRSGSMDRDGRWVPSVDAVRSITTDLQSQINFGLALFPQPPVVPDLAACLMMQPAEQTMCLNDALAALGMAAGCTPGNIVVPVGPNTGAMIGTTLDMTISQGGTPTGETLQNLVGTFGAPPADPDMIPAPRFVLLVTDGQPTCPNGGGEDTTPADIDIANTAIDALREKGVRTYVVGYNTTGPANAALAQVLDGFATRGGTGDMMHRPVENAQNLRDELQRIAGDVISCTFVLDKAPPRADHVLVRVDGVQVNLDDPNGWHLVGDRTVELTGATCEKLKSDGAHVVDAEVRCQVVVPI